MSSLFGALDTSVSGLSAQSNAFGNISDNVANAETTGFKQIDTSFEDYLTTSSQVTNDSGFVAARPEYANDVQGTIAASSNPLAMAISGQGFFQVATVTSTGSTTAVGQQQQYTRDGNFSLDKNGYLVNDTGQALEGWSANAATGVVDQNQVGPIQINQASFAPVATTTVTLAANLPATPAADTPVSSQVNVYDAKGTLHTLTLSWTQNATDDWTVAVAAPDPATPALGGAEVKFGPNSGNTVAAGTVGSVSNPTGGVTASSYAASGPATLNLTADFGDGAQAISLQLGNYGGASGLTQFAGTTYTLNGLSQNGIPPGAFSSVTAQSSGDVVVNYDNGQTRVVAQVPVVSFANADGLQRQDGQGFTATTQSGEALAHAAGSGGAGTLVTSSVENSNVDIASEFTKLIIAQQAYGANAKMITTASDMLTTTIDMKR